MTPVNQTIIDPQRGDCHRAAIASLLDLEIEQVPHLRLFSNDIWHHVMKGFLWGCGYEWHGTGYPHTHLGKGVAHYPTVDGYVIATVQSKEFTETPGITHAVIMDVNGLVVHDPQPNKKYQGINIIKTEELLHWSLIERRKDS